MPSGAGAGGRAGGPDGTPTDRGQSIHWVRLSQARAVTKGDLQLVRETAISAQNSESDTVNIGSHSGRVWFTTRVV